MEYIVQRRRVAGQGPARTWNNVENYRLIGSRVVAFDGRLQAKYLTASYAP